MTRRWLALLAIAIAYCLLCTPGQAASTVQIDHVALSVSLESPAKPGSTVWVAIRQKIAPGWHTYWRNPGDSGLATSLSWKLPKGVTAGESQWPVPERFTTGPIVNFGYKDEAILLVPLTIAPDAVIGAAPAQAHGVSSRMRADVHSRTGDTRFRFAQSLARDLCRRARRPAPGIRRFRKTCSRCNTIGSDPNRSRTGARPCGCRAVLSGHQTGRGL